MNNIDWKKIHEAHNGMFRENCWETCNSYCCNKKELIIPLFPGEYKFLEKNNLLEKDFEESHRQFKFNVKNTTFKIDTIICKLKGKCVYHQNRPVICKLFPLFPVVQDDGKIIGIEILDPFDMFWGYIFEDNRLLANPCTLVSALNPKLITQFINLCNNILLYPINIFYIMLSHIYKRNLFDLIINKYPHLLKEGPDIFFQKYKPFLRMKNMDTAKLKHEAEELFDKFTSHWGGDWYKYDDEEGSD